LLDKVVREYTPAGKVVWEAKTPSDPPECWPFTAIRLVNGHTHGHHPRAEAHTS